MALPNTYTLLASPDIFCYKSVAWFSMLPLTITYFILFGFGSFLYFLFVILYSKWMENYRSFNQINKFMLKRFKRKYFYWEAVVTLR